MFQALTGDETGLVKLLDLRVKTVLYNSCNHQDSSSSNSNSSSHHHQSQSRVNGCKSMAWCDPTGEDTSLASMLRANGVLDFYKLPDPTVVSSSSSSMLNANADAEETNTTLQLLSSLCLSDFKNPRGCFPLKSNSGDRLNLCYSSEGQVALIKSDQHYTQSKETGRFSGKILHILPYTLIDLYHPSNSPNHSDLTNTVSSLYLISYCAVRGPVEAGCGRGESAVFGGRENDIQLHNISTQDVLWKAKNVSNDKLSLRVPIYITAVKFLGEDATNKIITGTGYKQIRVYDVKAKRCPVVNFEIGGEEAYRITSILPSPDEKTVYIADSTGGLYLYDIGMRRRIFTLKGNFGSIRDLKTDPDGQYLAAVGLDRYIR